jgi:Kdo2-lipid IVA lauroyltransferase/acyltransferase
MQKNEPFRPSHFLAPRHWPTWLGLGLLRLTTLLPYRALVKAGELLGWMLYRIPSSRRHIVDTNLRLCFPELNQSQRDQLSRRNFQHTALALLETPYSWWCAPAKLEKLVTIEGIEHMQQALAGGRGAIMMGAHFTSMLMCGRLLAMHLPFHILVKPAKNPLYETLMRFYRERDYAGIINADDLRSMVRTLKRGEIVWYSPDQDLGRNRSVFAPFMGIPTATITATARLAKMSGAPIVPINFERLPDNRGYRMRLLPALEGFPSGDDVADATRINHFIEEHVREVPEQYLWAHRRFKTRPPGEPSVY